MAGGNAAPADTSVWIKLKMAEKKLRYENLSFLYVCDILYIWLLYLKCFSFVNSFTEIRALSFVKCFYDFFFRMVWLFYLLYLEFMRDQTLSTPRVTFSPLMFHSLVYSPPLPATTSAARTSAEMSFAASTSAIFALPSW